MATDTTPGSSGGDFEGRDAVPRWLLLLILAMSVLGGLWVLVSFFNVSRPA